MDWLQFAVQWLHVLLGIFWFGSALYTDFVLIPAVLTLPLARQREVGAAIGARAVPIINGVAGAVIVLGVIRGTAFGPIKSFGDLGTQYGLTWVVALVAAIATYLWGLRVITPVVMKLNAIPESEATGPDGSPSPTLAAIVGDIRRKTLLELLGFFVIFSCMILMRFGL